MRAGALGVMAMDVDLTQAGFAVDLDGDLARVDQLLRALAVAGFDHAVEIVDAMWLILDGHAAFAFFGWQALRYRVLRPGPRDGAIDGGTVYGHGDQAAVCCEPGAALGWSRGSRHGPQQARLDRAGHGRQQDLSSNEIALIDKRLEQSDPQTLQGIHRIWLRTSGGMWAKKVLSP